MIVNFEEIKLNSKKNGKCLCGKRFVRSKTFSQTLNPFNKKDGRLKTREEIWEELKTEAKKWQEIPVYCKLPTYWRLEKKQRKLLENGKTINLTASCGSIIHTDRKTLSNQ